MDEPAGAALKLNECVDISSPGQDAKNEYILVLGDAIENYIATYRKAAQSGAMQIRLAPATDMQMGREKKELARDRAVSHPWRDLPSTVQ